MCLAVSLLTVFLDFVSVIIVVFFVVVVLVKKTHYVVFKLKCLYSFNESGEHVKRTHRKSCK